MNKKHKKQTSCGQGQGMEAREPLMEVAPPERDRPVTQGDLREAILKINTTTEVEFSNVRGEMHTGLTELRGEMDTRFAEMDKKTDTCFAKMDTRFAELETKIEKSQNKIMRLILWTNFSLIGIVLTALFAMVKYLTG